ncbi:MAG: TetR/AcrR family transcriptional regulator C-terminal ligand-binding domain-containing protein [Candidatus Dormibacteraeota bacterium]|uniref:TetR/AcrR family transcriptional regulator C-terminal ligand-binding domain-containing protein n=1 Tax=Candidatus Dormiibacter inghamiae TaxID=3127013 RepID=A0A934KEM6_9BACT|nr:TetR/AcrR family transcriptional regulator C-terminal ligand-binding domain-containing protein [Candidatus Dormibacteraeota bacterium]MBJ7607564.1 TetR/AcrR family transcriptional regulator C-terminal ligand-binding domain-containing protein [Candidatus Dormibacteraeota bacterium]
MDHPPQPQQRPRYRRGHDGRVIEPHQQTMLKILRRGVARGEVRPDAVNRLVAQVGPILIRQYHAVAGLPSLADVVQIVDQVVIPLLRPSPPANSARARAGQEVGRPGSEAAARSRL